MDFILVELKKFLSHLHSTMHFKGRGLTLIEGDNGHGKTAMLDAVSWCLFGKTIRGIKDDNVVHRKYKSGTEVTVKLKKNTYEYTITRYRKHDEFKNRLMYDKRGTVTRDHWHVEEGTLDLTQAKLLRELDIDFDLFRCTVLFGQEDTFNFVNETNAEQKKILSKIMRVDFAKYLANAKAALKESNERLIDIDRKLAVLRSHEGNPDDLYADDVVAWDQEHSERVRRVKREIKEVKESLAATHGRLQEHDASELKALQATLKHKLALLDSDDDRFDVAGAKAKVLSLFGQIQNHKKLQKAGKCPTCETPVSSDKCKREIEELERQEKEAKAAHERAADQAAELINKRRKYQDKLDQIRDKLEAAANEARTLREETEALGEARGRLKELEAEENPFIAKIEQERERQGEIRAKIKELEREEESLKSRQPYLDFWARGFGDDGIKSFIFDLICSSLTAKANQYLNVLTGGEIQVLFDTQRKLKSGELRDKFDCTVILDGDALPYENYSGGQKTRISLAVDMALSDLMSDQYGSKFNIVAFDEQTTYMNEKGRKQFMNLLTKIADKRGVYVVDHDAEFKAQFNDVISVKMKNGVSHVT